MESVVLVVGQESVIERALAERLSSHCLLVGLGSVLPEGQSIYSDYFECDPANDKSIGDAFDVIRKRYGSEITSVIHLRGCLEADGLSDTIVNLANHLKRFRLEQFVLIRPLRIKATESAEQEFNDEVTIASDNPGASVERQLHRQIGDVPLVVLRIGGVYDRNGYAPSIAPLANHVFDKPLEVYFFPGDVERGHAFVNAADLAEAIDRVIQRRIQLGAIKVLVVAEPGIVSIRELQSTIGGLIHGEEWSALWLPKWLARVESGSQGSVVGGVITSTKPWIVGLTDPQYSACLSYTRDVLGWQPRNRFIDVLPTIVDFLKRDPDSWFETNNVCKHPEAEDEKLNAMMRGRRSNV